MACSRDTVSTSGSAGYDGPAPGAGAGHPRVSAATAEPVTNRGTGMGRGARLP